MTERHDRGVCRVAATREGTAVVKERPILFSAPMVRAILEGRKTQTRRVVNPQPADGEHIAWLTNIVGRPPSFAVATMGSSNVREIRCPYGAPGDRLWVRETWCHAHPDYHDEAEGIRLGRPMRHGRWCHYAASDYVDHDDNRSPWKPSIHMPRWASRITLEVTCVRVERVQSISKDDAIAEGARRFDDIPDPSPYGHGSRWSMEDPPNTDHCLGSPQSAFGNLWIKINGQESWDANPWVWVVEFKRVEAQERAA